jgi:hypothetical protein
MKLRYLLCLVLLLPLAACSVHVGGHRPPPYYAPPAHVEWRWDPSIDAYVVLGWPHLYYRDRTYYRWHSNHWYSSSRHDGPWAKGPKRMPPGLNKKYGNPGRGHGGGGY